MALTKTPIELSSTPSIVDGGNATAITIDSSENTAFSGSVSISHNSGDSLTLTKTTTEPSLRIEGDTDKDFVLTVSGEKLTITQNDGATDIALFDHDTKATTLKGNLEITGDITGVTDLYVDDQIISTGDTDTYTQFHQADGWRVVTGGSERFHIQGNQVVVNHDGHDADFRVETDDEANMFNIVGGSNMVMIGSTTSVAASQFQISSTSDRHQLSLTSGSNTSITGSGSADYCEGMVAVPVVSTGDVLSIPIYSQSNLWRPMYVELMFVTGEYNKTSGKGGFAKFTFAALNSIGNLSQIAVGGNVASVSDSGMNITVTFTNDYAGGLNNYEGVFMHYKVMSLTPEYFQAWNATLN